MNLNKEEFIYSNDFVFDSAFRNLIYTYAHGENHLGERAVSIEMIHAAREYLKHQDDKNKKRLTLALARYENLNNFEILEALKFVEFYKQKRDRIARMK